MNNSSVQAFLGLKVSKNSHRKKARPKRKRKVNQSTIGAHGAEGFLKARSSGYILANAFRFVRERRVQEAAPQSAANKARSALAIK